MIDIKNVLPEEEIKSMSLGDRMKWYEKQPVTLLEGSVPVIIRIDGKAFHTYTQRFDKPFDKHITGAMTHTMLKLCEAIQNVKAAYMQSDEISLIMTAHEHEDKQAWFGGKVSKIVSVAAGLATAHFNHYMNKMYWDPRIMAAEIVGDAPKHQLAIFDARAWNVPMDEANNVFVWRQQDAIRNSVSAMAQSNFSHKLLHGKNVTEMKAMLAEKGMIWDDLDVNLQRGFTAKKEQFEKDGALRNRWIVENETPVFSASKEYINCFMELPKP